MALRTVLLGLVIALCVYIAWLAMKWRRVQRKSRPTDDDRHANVFRDVDRFGAISVGPHSTGSLSESPTLLPEDDDSIVSLSSQIPEDDPVVRAPRPAEPDASSFGFDALLEVRQMRHLVDDLRTRHGRMEEEVLRLRNELMALRAASRVSPAYAEAVSMVERGLDAQAIAERCGISVAEAELVRSLSAQRGVADDIPAAQSVTQEEEWQQEGNQNKNPGVAHD